MNWYKKSKINKVAGKVDRIDNLAKQISRDFFKKINRGMKEFKIGIPYSTSGFFTDKNEDLIIDSIMFRVWEGDSDRTIIGGATAKVQEIVTMRGMEMQEGFMSISIFRGGPSKNFRHGIHPSERERIYMRLLNVVRHELVHIPQEGGYLFSLEGKGMDLYDHYKNYFSDYSEVEARAIGGFLEARKSRRSLREVYREELQNMMSNLRKEMGENFHSKMMGIVDGLVEKQVEIIENKLGKPLTGFLV